MRTIATGLAKALIAAMQFSSSPPDQAAREASRRPKYRRGFHGVWWDTSLGSYRAVWVDDKPGWSAYYILVMNARNGVGSSKIRKARAK